MQIFIKYVYVKHYHCTRALIINYVCSKFHVIGNTVRKIARNCVICIRYRSQQNSQLIGQLLAVRITVSRPFSNVGIYFISPFTCKCINHRSVKRFLNFTRHFLSVSLRVFGFLTWKVVMLENTMVRLAVTYSTMGTAVLLSLFELKYGISCPNIFAVHQQIEIAIFTLNGLENLGSSEFQLLQPRVDLICPSSIHRWHV